MNEPVNVLMGYSVSNSVFEEAEFIAEVQTNGTDTNGFQFQETLGVFKDEFEGYGLFKGSTDRAKFERCSAIHMSNCGYPLSDSLIDLGMKLKKMGL